MKEKYSFHISSNIIQPWHHAKAVCVKFGCHFFVEDEDEEVVVVRLRGEPHLQLSGIDK